LRSCTSKRTQFDYQLLKSKCAKYQNTNDYWHTVTPLEIPIITTASARGYNGATFVLAATKQNIDAPIAYYLIANIKTGQVNKVSPNNAGELSLSNLSSLTSYTFTIAAVSVDGTSLFSSITPVITTGAVPVVVVAPAVAPIAAPAFTLSSSSETKTVNNVIAGYTIDASAGGTIASYSISPAAPAGLTFSASTGLLSGTPTSVAVATTYTITGTNASGSATRTFTLTVAAVVVYTVGSTGPGGGTIFYVAASPFACGPTRATTCTYLEAAPALWNAGLEEPLRTWAKEDFRLTSVGYPAGDTATATAIGWGYRNTLAIISQGNWETATSAAALAEAHIVTVSGVDYDDWYLPSKDELNQMCKWARGITGVDLTTVATGCAGGAINTGVGAAGFYDFYYRSSSEETATDAWDQDFHANTPTSYAKSYNFRVRPVRAF
jgi:hypothetical protein